MTPLAHIMAMAAPYIAEHALANQLTIRSLPTPDPHYDEDAAKRIREERAARKAANFAKRNRHEN